MRKVTSVESVRKAVGFRRAACLFENKSQFSQQKKASKKPNTFFATPHLANHDGVMAFMNCLIVYSRFERHFTLSRVSVRPQSAANTTGISHQYSKLY